MQARIMRNEAGNLLYFFSVSAGIKDYNEALLKMIIKGVYHDLHKEVPAPTKCGR